MLSVKQHNVLQFRQLMMICHQPSYSNHEILMENQISRHIRKDFRKYSPDIKDVIPSDVDRLTVANAQKEQHHKSHKRLHMQ